MNSKTIANLKESYSDRGYFFPIPVLSDEEVAYFLHKYLEFYEYNRLQLQQLPAKEHFAILSETHASLNWVFRIASHPAVLNAVEGILGPDLMIWGSRWFSKMPGDKTFISWHQDATYWGLHPPEVTTAWIALSQSIPQNGCMRVVPRTHKGGLLPQTETYAPDNALSRGQEIAVSVDESQAVDISLQPGEMSLHHIGIVHGSKVNSSSLPRIGIAIRYISPAVEQDGERSLAMLVRGRDDYGHFERVDPPMGDDFAAAGVQSEVVRRMMASVMRKRQRR
jgi:chlorinating enzyme